MDDSEIIDNLRKAEEGAPFKTGMSKYQIAQSCQELAKAIRRNNYELSRLLFLEAAKIHDEFIHTLVNKKQTLAVFGLSAVSLYVKAEELDKAEALAKELLTQEIDTYCSNQLKGILASIAKV